MVFLCAEARERGAGREAVPDDGGGVLEGDRVTMLRLLIGKQGDWGEEKHGVLQGEVPLWEKDKMEDE